MSREAAIAHALDYFDSRAFHADLARRIAIRSESQEPAREAQTRSYLARELHDSLAALGCASRVVEEPGARRAFLIAERREADAARTVLTYAHGDVVRGQEGRWSDGGDPWTLREAGERLQGRGSADNKGQHTINLGALAAVLRARGRLGFNLRAVIEIGEEVGSPGLREICAAEREALAADVFIASDGPRLGRRPTLFLGSRGVFNFTLSVVLREGAHHSGNWGGLLANPAIVLAHALASLVDARGRVLVRECRPASIPEPVRRALADLAVDQHPGDPTIDAGWGEPGLSAAEKVYGWNTFDVLALRCADGDRPVNAIPPEARAHCSIRYVAGCDPATFLPAIERHLARHGFACVDVAPARDLAPMAATRLDPDHPWVRWAVRSIARTTGEPPAVLPNLGGSLPNDVFADLLGLPTLWVPHSHAACNQHAPDEHLLAPLARQGLAIMAGLWWDLGEPDAPGL
jgi:acetylornithine deacetylase/succinyl-diaminopimelate desuccinylase-like protein